MTKPGQPLRILLISQDLTRSSMIEEGLREAGHSHVTVVRELHNLMRRIQDEDPEVIFIDLGIPRGATLERMFQLSRCVRRPIGMFVDSSDAATIRSAVEAGIGAYIVDGLRKERVGAILEMAVSRFRAFSELREELERARQALQERKLIERAKGILMKERGLSEEAAYGLLRKAAMNENRRLAEIAGGVVSAARRLKS